MGHFAVEIDGIGQSVPGFHTDKGGVSAGRLPDQPDGCGGSHARKAPTLAIEHLYGLHLAAIEDQSLVGEGAHFDGHERIAHLVEGQRGEGLQILAPGDGHTPGFDAALAAGAQHVAGCAFEAEETGNVLAVLGPVGEVECGMRPDLEPHGAVERAIHHAEIGAEGASAQGVDHFEAVGPRKLPKFLIGVLHSQVQKIDTLLHQLPISPAHETVLGYLVTAAVESARPVPQSACDGEENGRTAVPIGGIALPNDFAAAVEVYETLDFCAPSRDFESQVFIL